MGAHVERITTGYRVRVPTQGLPRTGVDIVLGEITAGYVQPDTVFGCKEVADWREEKPNTGSLPWRQHSGPIKTLSIAGPDNRVREIQVITVGIVFTGGIHIE